MADFGFAFLERAPFLAFAHRGGDEIWPENTMAAFQDAVDLGYRYLEIDVRATRDGVLLGFHDDNFHRMAGRPGQVEAIDYRDIHTVKVSGTEPLPLLEDILGAWPDICVNIEPKHDSAVDPLIAVIKKTGALDRVCIGSFTDRRLTRLRTLMGPKLCTSMGPREVVRLRLASFGLPVGRFEAACVQVPVTHKGVTIVDRRFIAAASARNLPVHVWTVNQALAMKKLIDLGVYGIMTDRLRVLKQVLISRGLWTGS